MLCFVFLIKEYSGRFDDRSVAKSKDHSSDNRYSERSSPRRYKNDDDRNDRRSIDNSKMILYLEFLIIFLTLFF